MGNIIRQGPPWVTRNGIDDIRRRTACNQNRSIFWKRSVVFWVAAIEGKSGRQHGTEIFNHGRRESDNLCFGVDLAAVLLEYRAGLFIPHQQTNVLKDLQRGGVGPFDLFLRKKGGEIY